MAFVVSNLQIYIQVWHKSICWRGIELQADLNADL